MPVRKHSVETGKSSLQIDESLSLHRTGWIVQRIGWVIIVMIMIAGLLGLFGEGMLSKTEPASGGIKATYERFFRFEAEMKIVVESSGDHISNISFSQSYLKNFKILRFIPEPEGNNTSSGEVIYNFLPAQNRLVTIYLTPTNQGGISGDMKVNRSNVISLHHFIYP